MVLHKDSIWKENWDRIKETNPIIQGNVILYIL
jgi:hypothetical protein